MQNLDCAESIRARGECPFFTLLCYNNLWRREYEVTGQQRGGVVGCAIVAIGQQRVRRCKDNSVGIRSAVPAIADDAAAASETTEQQMQQRQAGQFAKQPR